MPAAEVSNITYVPQNDWLYESLTHIYHGKCDYDIKYSPVTDASGTLAQYVTTLLYAAAFVAVLLMPRRREEQPEEVVAVAEEVLGGVHIESFTKANKPRTPRERWAALDLIRISTVIGIVSEHSGGTYYSEHNFLFTAEWVLQYLFLVSGIAFMFSQASFLSCARHAKAVATSSAGSSACSHAALSWRAPRYRLHAIQHGLLLRRGAQRHWRRRRAP